MGKKLRQKAVPRALDAMGLAEAHLMAAASALGKKAKKDETVAEAVSELHSAIEAVRIAGGLLQEAGRKRR